MLHKDFGLEIKATTDAGVIEGYGSTFGGEPDSVGDIIMPGAYKESLAEHSRRGTTPKMFWQHDPHRPIGKWLDAKEDDHGLLMRGRLNMNVQQGREAYELLKAGDIDGLSIGYRTVTAEKDAKGQRLLREVELWEVSLVTFPMLPEARVSAKGDLPEAAALRELAALFEAARRTLAGRA